ncbi:MAG: hypothetical protein KBT10_03775, partial [Bacteroidales bacterium]|nr:hypothetical protein [Candidatus Sodaliphilus aphodohippi]
STGCLVTTVPHNGHFPSPEKYGMLLFDNNEQPVAVNKTTTVRDDSAILRNDLHFIINCLVIIQVQRYTFFPNLQN